MSKRGLIVAATWATATFGLVLAVGLPANLNAGDTPAAPAVIDSPKIIDSNSGIELSIDFDGAATRPAQMSFDIGNEPTLQVHAQNKGKDQATSKFTVTMLETQPVSRLSRSMPMAQTIWTKDCSVTLAPGEQKTLTLATGTALPRAGRMSIVIRTGDQTIAPLNVAVNDPNNPLPAGFIVSHGGAPTTQPIVFTVIPDIAVSVMR